MFVTFSGVDGSGKSTLARMVYKKLRELGFNVKYHREFEYFLLKYVITLLGTRANPTRDRFMDHNEVKKPFYFRIWPFFVWLDCVISWFYFRFLERKYVIIFDRYICDFLAAWEYYGYSNKLIRYLNIRFPKPDFAFLLNPTPRVAFLRRNDPPLVLSHFYIPISEKYLEIARQLDIKLIDTNQPLEESFNQIWSNLLPALRESSSNNGRC
jgi:dTMP kinase